MNRKQLINAIIVLVVLGVVSFFTFRKDASKWERGDDVEKKKLIENLDVNAVAKLAIITDKDSLEIVKGEKGWKVLNREGYPANFEKLSNLLLSLKNLEIAQYPRVMKSQFGAMKLISPVYGKENRDAGILLQLSDKNNKPITSLVLGELHFQEKENNDSYKTVRPDGRYLRLRDSDKPALVTNPLSNADPDPKSWLDNKFIKITKSISVQLSGSDGKKKWRIYRKNINEPWVLEGIKKGEKPLPRQMLDATSAFEKISFEDVSLAAEAELKGTQDVTIETEEGIVYTIKLLVKEKKVFAKFAISGKATTFKPMNRNETDKEKREKEFKDKMDKLKAEIEKEHFYTKWLYEFSIYKIEKILKERKDLFKPAK